MKTSLLLTTVLAAGFLPIAALGQTSGQAPETTPTPPPASLDSYATADALWQHIQELLRGPAHRPQTDGELRSMITVMDTQVDAALKEFLSRYPSDPRQWDAKLMQVRVESMLANLSGNSRGIDVKPALEGIASAKEAPQNVRMQASRELLMAAVNSYLRGDKTVTPEAVMAELHQYAADYPANPALDVDKYKVAMALKGGAPDASMALLKELTESGNAKLAETARSQMEAADKMKAALDIHYTAVDGRDVDLTKLRGKVVLVDFRATWCGPCKAEVPHVVEAYQKLHDKGFEIVGVSLDQDKNALTAYTAAHGMTWPQYFDGKGWQNQIATEFGVQSIPAMWLVNKQGYVVTTNGRADLEGEVEKLLAE
jgi:thiol-disulfide isomerase/thioredoxin